MNFIKEKKLWGTTLMITLGLIGVMIAGIFYSQGKTEASLEQAESEPIEVTIRKEDELYKNQPYLSEKVIRKVCEKFDLDYDTVTNAELTEEMFDYEMVADALITKGEQPVLASDKSKDMALSLEVEIGDIYAFHGAKEVIEEVCNAAGIDAATAKIKDLSEETLLLIHERAYQVSDHPKN
ncbi:hypothetical protein [Enterococcus sp. DIV0756]|uniref:hypothetical protein n=1 Tax=Enterococcus sp. DIV0756 TaxID=2774636 RepID=UPI003F2589AB